MRAAPGGAVVFDRGALVAALRAAGLAMTARGTIDGDVLGVPAYNYENREGPVQVFEFATEERARAAAGRVSKDGHNIASGDRISHYDWIAPPHWFRRGHLVALYLGTD
ncbi:MAG: hypothetical protein H0W29_16380, partial [Gemmatimonadales bacterium]|nr:hypothetical protein [Gemmatimonadales bacterium]